MEYNKDDYIKLLLNFAESGSLSMVKNLVEEKNIDASAADKVGCTALHKSASSGHIDIVRYLLSKGVNIDSKIECNNPKLSGITPVLYAVNSGHHHVAKFLIEQGADTSVVVNGLNLLDVAVDSDNPSVIGLILEKGFSVEQCFSSNLTPLARALSKGKCESVKFLLEIGANYKISGPQDDRSPLYYAVQESSECTELLLKHVETKEGKGRMIEYINSNHLPMMRTALHLACFEFNYKTVKVLLQYGADPSIQDAEGLLPYDLITSIGDIHVGNQIKLLLKGSDKEYNR